MLILLSLVPFSSCGLLNEENGSLQATWMAIGIQQTLLAHTSTAFAGFANQATLVAPNLIVTPSPASTDQPDLNAPDQTDTPVAPPSPAAPEPNARQLAGAKILLFEDMSASRYIRYVKEALDRGGYFYLDVGSAKGWFKSQLLSPQNWDLVIAAAEARRDFGGEFFEYIDNHLAQGAGAIIEYWDLDAAPQGRVTSLLDRCGVSFQADWYEPDMRVFFWVDPTHPVFHQPNEIPSHLGNASTLWIGDIGDLLKIKGSASGETGDAQILAGANPNWKTDHGTLVSCVGGRLILQTFSSHEYAYNEMVSLWQNYVYQSLKSHFALTGNTIPTPAVTAIPRNDSPPTPPGPTPGPAYLYNYSCGDIFTAKLLDAPEFQGDLFEHHANGTFLILRLQLVNQTDYPFQVWDEDYFIEATFNGKPVVYSPQPAATGYLYIESPTNLYQDLIQPNETWRTALAFDVDPDAGDWVLVVKPGNEFNEQICEARIPLTK